MRPHVRRYLGRDVIDQKTHVHLELIKSSFNDKEEEEATE
jgi:hypothetical protein